MQQMKKLLALFLFFCVGWLPGCATDQLTSSYKALSISKETAIAVARTAKDLNARGVINDDQLLKVKEGYEAGQQAQAALVEALQESLDAGELNPEGNEKYLAALNIFTKAMTTYTRLAIDLGILGPEGKPKT